MAVAQQSLGRSDPSAVWYAAVGGNPLVSVLKGSFPAIFPPAADLVPFGIDLS